MASNRFENEFTFEKKTKNLQHPQQVVMPNNAIANNRQKFAISSVWNQRFHALLTFFFSWNFVFFMEFISPALKE